VGAEPGAVAGPGALTRPPLRRPLGGFTLAPMCNRYRMSEKERAIAEAFGEVVPPDLSARGL